MIDLLKKKSIPFVKKNSCPCCLNNATKIIDLPDYPITEFYTSMPLNDGLFGFFDQSVLFCQECDHLFLDTILDPNIIYNNYLTSTNSSKGAVDCLNSFRDFILKTTELYDFSSVIDIGGNDSSFLELFDENIENLINIDVNASTKSEKIKVNKRSWAEVDFNEYIYNKPRIFTSSHTIEHLDEPIDFIEKISNTMKNDDLFYLQFPSLELISNHKRFDQLCHQHLNIFSLKSIQVALNKNGLYVNEYEFDSGHFGTLRLKISKNNVGNISNNVVGIQSVEASYKNFTNFYKQLNMSYESIIDKAQGFGAGLMVPTLIYNLPILDNLKSIFDQDESRINKRYINFSPQIKSDELMDESKPIIITAISTKSATRSIINYLSTRDVRDILIPTIVT